MKFDCLSFRWGLEHTHPDEQSWLDIQDVIRSITRKDVIDKQLENFEAWKSGKKNPATGKIIQPAVGGQSVLNSVIADKFAKKGGWDDQIYVLNQSNKIADKDRVPYWTMDFRKNKIGLEISFNNAGVLPRICCG